MTALQAQWAIAKAQAQATLARLRTFDPNQPRDEDGKWTDTGAGDGGTSGAEKPVTPAPLDPAVTNVGGDEWNQRTAERLEREYQAARPKVDALAQSAPGKTATVAQPSEEIDEPPEEDDEPFVPEEWDMLSGSAQSEAEEQYIDKNTDSFYDSEVENWSSEYAPGEAKEQVAEDFNAGQNNQWAMDALNEMRGQRKEDGQPPIPYTNEQLLEAMQIVYDKDKYKAEPVLGFDDDKLQEPSNLPPPEQETLPGIEPADPSKQLKEEMREDIEKWVLEAFHEESDSVMDKMEPPEYLKESAAEFAGESWSSMGDTEKFEWVKNYTNIVEDESTGSSKPDTPNGSVLETVHALPTKFDPLQEGHGEANDYKRTQTLARWLSVARTREVLTERKLPALMDDTILARVDKQLWSAWKSSSTSFDGMLLQVATADELGGRLNTQTARDINRESMVTHANREYAAIGGYDGVKAYLRAKWEVTQYLLDKAGVKELELFRGVTLSREMISKLFAAWRKHLPSAQEVAGGFTHMPTLHVARNGAASTTTDASVANGWGADSSRIVLRALVPRTAALSVPAYGINVHGEREVVIAGTAWRGWDAWKGKAPEFDKVPLKHAA